MASRKIEVQIVGDASSLSKAFGNASQSSGKFGSAMGKVGKLAVLGLAGAGVAAAGLGAKMVSMASDAAEVQSKMDVVFGKALPGLTKQIDKFSAATGTSRFAMREQAADMGALLAPMLGSKQGAADMSLQFTKLATDIGSFNNVPTADALLAIRSGLVGEAEPLRRFGVLLNAAAVDAEGLRLGLVKKGQTMTEQQKVQARANLIMQQTSLAQGDATRTAGSMANQMKMLKSNISDTATSLGMHLLPAANAVVGGLNDFISKLRDAEGAGGKFNVVLDTIKTGATSLGSSLKDAVAGPHFKAVAARFLVGLKDAFTSINWGALGASLGKDLTGALNKLSSFVNSVNWNAVGQAIISGLGRALSGLGRFLAGVNWPSLLSAISKGIEAVMKAAGTLALGLATALGRAIVHGIGLGLAKLKPWVKEKLQAIPGALREVASQVPGWAAAIGRAIVDGIIAGASGLGGRLSGALTSQISGAVSSVKGFFGIRSPSTYTAEHIGKPLAEGIASGMAAGLAVLQGQVAPALAKITKKMEDQVNAARSRMQSAFGGLADKLLRAFDAESGGHQTAAGAALDAIAARRQMEDMTAAVTDAQARLAEAMAGGDSGAIAEAQRALFRAQEDIQMLSLEAQRVSQEQAYTDQRDAQREHLEARLAALSEAFSKEGATVKGAMARINKIMRSFGITFAESGQLVGAQFVAGLQRAIGASAAGAANVQGANAGQTTTVKAPGIPVVQVILDGKVLAESNRKHDAVYTRNNGVLAV